MRIRSMLAILLIAALALSLAACGGKLPVEDLVPGTGEAPASTAPTTTAAPEPAISAAPGAESLEELLEKALDFLHNDCDFDRIADVTDQQARIAEALLITLYDVSYATETFTEITWEEALEKAALIQGDAETLEARDPELAAQLREKMVVDPEPYVNDYVDDLRDAILNGEITEDHPNYETLSQIAEDWDKGADYIMEHHPELIDAVQRRGLSFSLEGAMELFRKYGRFEDYNSDLLRFRDFSCEYQAENAERGRNGGIFIYDMGSMELEEYHWTIRMLYWVRDGAYYLIDFTITVV